MRTVDELAPQELSSHIAFAFQIKGDDPKHAAWLDAGLPDVTFVEAAARGNEKVVLAVCEVLETDLGSVDAHIGQLKASILAIGPGAPVHLDRPTAEPSVQRPEVKSLLRSASELTRAAA